MSYHSLVFKEGWRTYPRGATCQVELGRGTSRGRHKSLLTTGFGDLPCPYDGCVLSAQGWLKQTGQCRIGPAGCTSSFCCSRWEGGKEGTWAKPGTASICPSHLYGKKPCTMATPSTAVGWFPLPEQETSKVVSDENASTPSAAGMWMTQTNGLGIAGAGAGEKKRQNLAEKQKSRLIICLTPMKLPWKNRLRPKQANSVSLWGQLQKPLQAQWNHKMSPLSVQILGRTQESVFVVHQD